MTPVVLQADELEKIVDRGLLDMWYALVPSDAVGTSPISLRRVNEQLVLWRDSAGAVHVQRDECPHRGARLSLGRVLEDRLTCWYHGVQIDGDGTIADVPALPGCPLVGRHGVRTFPSRETGGVIFAYFGADEHAQPRAFAPPGEFEDPEWSHFVSVNQWKVNYRYVIENIVDLMHASYLHSNSFTLAYGKKDGVMEIEDTPAGFVLRRANQRNVNFDEVELLFTGSYWQRLDIPYPNGAGPGGPFRVITFATPIDDNESVLFAWRLRAVSGWERDLWRFMYRDRLEKRHWDVLEQDRLVSETMPAQARKREMLYQHDVGVTRLRKLMRAQAKEQIAGPAAPAVLPANGSAAIARHDRTPDLRGVAIDDIASRYVARFSDRVPDWEAFEDAKIDGFRRAQHRFIGGGGSGKTNDPNAIPPGGFTLSIMYVEPGQGNAAHTHEVEEVFFVLRGELMVFLEDETGRTEVRLAPWECISCPAGVVHGYLNESAEPVYFQVMISKAKPEPMGYADEQLFQRRADHLLAAAAPEH
jgi:phenylpropionate dioxygenase-like ring-hydroxylating dioxygenase large terminal subunit/mannose-6-phosphate isomerase-like protein (cupin superfamily)